MLLMNEKIKAAELEVTGLDGEDRGIMKRDAALALAKQLKADLVCTSLFSSPPPCKLVARGTAKQAALSEKQAVRREGQSAKVKEIRLTAKVEEHDYETKLRQCERILTSGDAVQLVVKLTNAKEGAAAKELLERLSLALAATGKRETGIQVSGKQAAVRLNPC